MALRFTMMDTEQLCRWLVEQNVSADIVANFRENEMDGEALVTLLTTVQGPDCLKDLIPKLGVRLKVYQRIKVLYNEENGFVAGEEIDDVSSVASSKEGSCSGGSSNSEADHHEINRLKEEITALSKEKKALQVELEHGPDYQYDTEQMTSPSTIQQAKGSSNQKATRSKTVSSSSTDFKKPNTTCSVTYQELPDPFQIPTFRHSTEVHLNKGAMTDSDRKYMVQTLATLLMTYKSKPSLRDCLIVSRSLHQKFPSLGDESSESSWKWFIYTRAQNVNRKHSDDDGPPKKKSKFDSIKKHEYPPIPSSANDEVSDERNMRLLKEEWSKTKQVADSIKELFIRTHTIRRTVILSSDYTGVGSILHEFPMLKRCTYAKLEFELIMQRRNLKDEFDEELVLWCKAVVNYCKKTCTKSTSIQSLVKDVENCDDHLLMISMRCLGLLLIPTKTKRVDGDIPFFIQFVPNDTPPSEAPQEGNNQPHLVVFNHDEFDQFFVSIERKLFMECADLASALFLLLGSHYILNLSYHQKLHDMMTFLQEKVAGISSASTHKSKSPVAVNHINGISAEYDNMKSESSPSDTE